MKQRAYRILTWASANQGDLEYVDKDGKFTKNPDQAKVFYNEGMLHNELSTLFVENPSRWFMLEGGKVTISVEWDSIVSLDLNPKEGE